MPLSRKYAGIDFPGSPAALASVPTLTNFAVYGLRRLNPNWTGNLIQVRRSSDSAVLDIGFIPSGPNVGELNVAGLLSFVGTGSGFVSKVYDQSGNVGSNLDLVQATAAAQPRIVNAGVLDTMAGKPVMEFLGTSYLVASGISMVQPIAMLTAMQVRTGNGSAVNLFGNVTGNFTFVYKTSGTVIQLSTGETPSLGPNTITLTTPMTVSIEADYGDSKVQGNSIPILRGASGTNGLAGLEVGSALGGTSKAIMSLSEFMVGTIVARAYRDAIEANQISYYGLAKSRVEQYFVDAWYFEGNSLTYGQNSTNTPDPTVQGTGSYPHQFIAGLANPTTRFFKNVGVPGQTLGQMVNRANYATGLVNFTPPSVSSNRHILFIEGGTNDIINSGVSAQTAFNSLCALTALLSGTGKFTRIYTWTIPPSGASTNSFAQKIFDFNNLIRQGVKPGGALLAAGAYGCIDLSLDPHFDDTPANCAVITGDTTIYNADKTHLTNLGYGLQAAQITIQTGLS